MDPNQHAMNAIVHRMEGPVGMPQMNTNSTTVSFSPQSHNLSSPPQVKEPLVQAGTPSPRPRSDLYVRPSVNGDSEGVQSLFSQPPREDPNRSDGLVRKSPRSFYEVWKIGIVVLLIVAGCFMCMALYRSSTFIQTGWVKDTKETFLSGEHLQNQLGMMGDKLAKVEATIRARIKTEDVMANLLYEIEEKLQNPPRRDALAESGIINEPRSISNVSLLIPCGDKHFHSIDDLMESLRAQTRAPLETIIALSIEENHDKELLVGELVDCPSPVKVHVRGGTHYAGENREFLLNMSRGDVVSFFDCDDFMHPRRIEVIDTVFKANPELDAALHGYTLYARKDWNETAKENFISRNFTEESISKWEPSWPYEELWNAPPITKEYNNKTWDVNDQDSEPPNYLPELHKHWWFPSSMGLKGMKVSPHNGWLSVRRRVAMTVPYPDTKRGQDSLYNWRLIKSQKNFSVLEFVLGAYFWGKKPTPPPPTMAPIIATTPAPSPKATTPKATTKAATIKAATAAPPPATHS